jgi:hypothetical protein
MCQPVTLASGESSRPGQFVPFGVAVDATSVYWTNVTGGTVMKVGLDGGSPTTLAENQGGPHNIVIDATNVYWANQDGTLMTVGLDGGTPAMLASGPVAQYTGIAVDATSVYWTVDGMNNTGGTVLKVALDGGMATTLATDQLNPTSIAVDATSVYWTSTLGGPGVVMKVAVDGGLPEMFAPGDASGYGNGLVTDARNVYWTGRFSVSQIGLDGTAPIAIFSSSEVGLAAIAVDATSVYWTDNTFGRVMKVARGGGTPFTLASGLTFPMGIAVDATYVYWAENSSMGSVSKVAK